jgi:hypothetical protein
MLKHIWCLFVNWKRQLSFVICWCFGLFSFYLMIDITMNSENIRLSGSRSRCDNHVTLNNRRERHYLASQSFDFEPTWWKLFQKRIKSLEENINHGPCTFWWRTYWTSIQDEFREHPIEWFQVTLLGKTMVVKIMLNSHKHTTKINDGDPLYITVDEVKQISLMVHQHFV